MKADLYVLHTQYNLIIGMACAIQTGMKLNDLILCAEFSLEPSFEEKLNELFRNVWIVQREHSYKRNFGREMHLYKLLRKLDFLTEHYDRVFISEEEYFDTYVFSKIKKLNSSCKMCCIEEDVYYSALQKYNTLEYDKVFSKMTGRSPIKFLQKIVRQFLFGKNPYFEEHYFYGGNSHFETLYVNYPNALRVQLQNRKGITEITGDNILQSIQILYGKEPIKKFNDISYVLILLDLISRYKDRRAVEKYFSELIDRVNRVNIPVLYKYHPMETESISALEQSNITQRLDSKIPSEKFLFDLMDKRVCVLGNASYSILLANKIGFIAVTTSKIMGTCNLGMEEAYQKIGIKMPNTFDELIEIMEEAIR